MTALHLYSQASLFDYSYSDKNTAGATISENKCIKPMPLASRIKQLKHGKYKRGISKHLLHMQDL